MTKWAHGCIINVDLYTVAFKDHNINEPLTSWQLKQWLLEYIAARCCKMLQARAAEFADGAFTPTPFRRDDDESQGWLHPCTCLSNLIDI